MPYYEYRQAIDMESENGGLQANATLTQAAKANWKMAMNVVDDTEDVREMRWAVNGRDSSNTINMKGWRCKTVCPDLVEPVEEAGENQLTVLWSEASTWPNLPNRIPLEGEEVEIMKGMVVVYDIGVSPKFKSLEVNGNLSFLRGQPAQLNTYSMWVRSG